MKTNNFSEKTFKASTVATLKAVRKNEMGVFLDAQTGNTSDDILLHKSQQTSPVDVNDTVKVFLYKDPKGRLTASMRVPKMKEGQIARLKVINISKDGAFLDVGAERGIFMPYAGMRGNLKIGDYVWAKLYTDKSGRLAVTMKVEDEMRRASKPAAASIKIGSTIDGSVYNITEEGAFIFTTDRNIAFIAEKEMPQHPHVGEEVSARVTYIRSDGRLNASLRPIKEKALFLDAASILKEIQLHQGKMPYSDKTPPEIIKERFHISKSAFKRAVGHLLKTNEIIEKDGWLILNKLPEK
ncbi:CvfB family protein [Pectinatus sottacetonis]|uniref:CvfB family protein n=1 Tax=Pectinatus sottacetonis TaxID=1002795 RepID=UPI0018C51CC2|nr:S1-like domain-containing RNA-binding protein [Pectinatus sottacetonis]